MKTIKKKIETPFILLIIMIPFMIMILFNFAMNIYIDRSAKEDLKNNAASIEILIRQQLMDSASARLQNRQSDPEKDDLSKLEEGLRQAKLSLLYSVRNMNIEFLLLSSDGKILYPKSFTDSFLNEKLISKSITKLSRAKEGSVVEFRTGGEKFFASRQFLTDRTDSTELILISSGSAESRIVRIVNLMLFSIILLAAGISSVITMIVSNGISKPITRLSGYAKRIGNGEYLTLDEDKSSVEIHELTRSMNEMSNHLKSYDTAQRSFLQNASHELRTPLMSIQGYAEGIASGVFTDTVKTAEIICAESRRLNTLVEELLTLSRIENKSDRNELTCLDLTDVIMDDIQRINGYAIKEGKEIKLEILNKPLVAKIDHALLSQAVINIISNCIRYANNEIGVSIFESDKFAIIRITDDGNGIAAEDLPHLFERFYKGKKGDFGLGLSIAKSAVEFMNGKLDSYNSGNGAVFEIRLPLWNAQK